jgi:iron complex outermembrane receptor protein
MNLFGKAAVAATGSFCLLSGPLLAQAPTSSGAVPAASATDDGPGLAEIIVTAQHRSENLQNVPVAVTALSSEFLEANNIRTLQDLAASVPGFVTTNSVNYGSAPLSIRGVGGANGGGNVLSDEPVAVYVDDAVVGRLRFSTADLVDVGSVEVLRGPQGTLYGRNSTAGAVLVHSAEPTADFSAAASVSAAQYNEERVQAAVSGPLTTAGALLGRLAAGFSDSGGWGNNLAGGPNLNRGRNWEVRGFLRYEPVSGLRIDLIADASYQLSFPGVLAISPVANYASAANPNGSNVVLPYVVRPGLNQLLSENDFDSNVPTFTEISGQNVTARVVWDLEHQTLTSISNYRTWNMHGQQDSDGNGVVPLTPLFVSPAVTNIGDNDGRFVDSQYSQEIRLNSSTSDPLQWTVGAFYYHENNAVDPIDIYNRLAGPGGDGTDVSFTAYESTNSFAGYVDGNYSLTDAIKLDLGARYSNEHKRIIDSEEVTTIAAFTPPGPVTFPAGLPLLPYNVLTGARTDNNFSPRAVLDYKIAPTTLAYASFSEGYLSGGFNAFRGTNFQFAPEHIKAYEMGLKTDVGRMLRVDGDVFHYDYTDLQVRTPVATGGVDIQTAAKARVNGAELESTFTPLAGLTFTGNATYLDAKFVQGALSTIDQPSWVFGTNPTVTTVNIAGNRLTRAPELQFALTSRYEWSVGNDTAAVQAGARHQGSEYFLETQQQSPTFQGSGWTEYDARASLAGPGDHWKVSLFGRNLFDNRHFTQITAFFGLPNGAVNDPRTIGVELAVKY